ncbi:MAG TPA: GNAT family N-acetyltransferase [Verrucomicrobiae bacterium]
MKAVRGFVLSPAVCATDLAAARELFQEYADGLAIDLCFQNFAEELASLPGNYAPPKGCLLLAKVDECDVGCIAVRPLEPGIAELKRLFVQPSFRGRGIAKSLIEAALAFAQHAGHRVVRLDTLREMKTAIALYSGFGFKEIPPYNAGGVEGIQYFELKLAE